MAGCAVGGRWWGGWSYCGDVSAPSRQGLDKAEVMRIMRTARLDNRRKTGRCNTVTPEVFRKGGSNRNAVSLQAPIAFVRGSALPKHFGRFAFVSRAVLHTSARANVRGRVELNRVRLLTSQRSKPSRGTCRNRQIGNDARSSRYERLEDESSHIGAAVRNRMAECKEVSLLGLSYDWRLRK